MTAYADSASMGKIISNRVLVLFGTLVINFLLFALLPLLAETDRVQKGYGDVASVVTMNKPQLIEKMDDQQKQKVLDEDDLKRLPEKTTMPTDQKARAPQPQLQLDVPRFDLAASGKGISGMGVAASQTIAGIDSVFNLDELDQKPRLISRIQPIYPYDARRKGITGRVFLKFIVNSGGMVTNVSVVNAEPEGVFDKNAIEAVLKWRFEPGIYKGKPVDTRVTLPIEFDMK